MKRNLRQKDHPLYRRWTNIRYEMDRDPSILCDWRNDEFWEYVDYTESELGKLPDPKLKLIRKNPDLGWVKGNLMYADHVEAGRHYRSARMYKINGLSDNVTGWARRYNVNVYTVYSRLENGWPIKKALGIIK